MLTIAITTYNRKKILERMASSFYASEPTIDYNLMIFDDSSDEYGEEFLRSLFPNAKKIEISDENKGADASMKHMYKEFLSSDDNIFFNADADLIFSKNWCEDGLKFLSNTDGVVSLFNTPNHPGICIGNGLCEKTALGAAGTIFKREVVELFMQALDKETTDCFDWKWSEFLQKKGIRLYSTVKSYVQHIGIIGQNCGIDYFDYGDGFIVDSELNGQILNDTIEDISKSKIKRRVVPMALFPFNDVDRNSNIIIYGAGKFGNDYKKQIESTNYCRIVAIIDTNYYVYDGVLPISEVTTIKYDKIVIAINDKDVLKEAIQTLDEYGVDRKKIVFKTGIKEILPS